ncbi:hypothetical protein [Aeromicrobium ginsengisoli]|uniref:restriction system modified-DNA reader domain-containing protein n=1 Tax=Aeromicrobium ginsengisoli TaxID=363867 RepID=UPI003CCC7269
MSGAGNGSSGVPFTVLVPQSVAEPITIYEPHAALIFAIVERDHALTLGPEWEGPGAYILLDPPATDGSYGCYVGKATTGVRVRLSEHLRSKPYWRRALAIRRDTTHGFNSAQVAWLEGRLHDLLAEATKARLHNGNRPSDETLPAYERAMLEGAVLPIERALRVMGCDTTSGRRPLRAQAEKPQQAVVPHSIPVPPPAPQRPIQRGRSDRYNGITLRTLADAGLLHQGWRIRSKVQKWPAEGVVGENGVLQVNGQSWANPSPLANTITGSSTNGWIFWIVETPGGDVTLSDLRDRFLESKP